MSDPSPSSANCDVLLYTDGACSGNPGPGGWGCILRHPVSGSEKELSGGAAETTNNQMELQAVISGLSALTRPTRVQVITDSTYVAKGCSEWMRNWKKNDWRRKDGRNWVPVKNAELWQELDRLLSQHRVTFRVVKGHSGHPENERCDELAVEQAAKFRNC